MTRGRNHIYFNFCHTNMPSIQDIPLILSNLFRIFLYLHSTAQESTSIFFWWIQNFPRTLFYSSSIIPVFLHCFSIFLCFYFTDSGFFPRFYSSDSESSLILIKMIQNLTIFSPVISSYSSYISIPSPCFLLLKNNNKGFGMSFISDINSWRVEKMVLIYST